MDTGRVRANGQLREMRPEGGGAARQALALPASPLELKSGSGRRGLRCLAPCNHKNRWRDPTVSPKGSGCSFRWIWSRWCPLGNEDEPSSPDAWAARSWTVGTRRAYAQKLAKIAEFQEASGAMSLAGVLAEFLATRAEASERHSTLRGYSVAVRAAKDLRWIGPVVHQLHKRIAQAVSKMGFQPYLPPEGLCVLVQRAELQPGALPMAYVAVLCWILWLRVGEVSSLRMVDVSFPLWMQFWISKTGEEGWQSRPLSPWADGFREALLR